jgi:hypothetical protein
MFTATQMSDNSFTFNADYQTQANAEKSCQKQGAHLAVYENEDEQLEVCCWLPAARCPLPACCPLPVARCPLLACGHGSRVAGACQPTVLGATACLPVQVETYYINNGWLLPDFYQNWWIGLNKNSSGSWVWTDGLATGEAACWPQLKQARFMRDVVVLSPACLICAQFNCAPAVTAGPADGGFTNWATGQPNAPQSCVTSTASQPLGALGTYTWLENGCSQTFVYICRIVGALRWCWCWSCRCFVGKARCKRWGGIHYPG